MWKARVRFPVEETLVSVILDSLVVRISACHVEGLYSIPGRGDFVCLLRCAVGSASVSLSEDCEFEPPQGKHFKKTLVSIII